MTTTTIMTTRHIDISGDVSLQRECGLTRQDVETFFKGVGYEGRGGWLSKLNTKTNMRRRVRCTETLFQVQQQYYHGGEYFYRTIMTITYDNARIRDGKIGRIDSV